MRLQVGGWVFEKFLQQALRLFDLWLYIVEFRLKLEPGLRRGLLRQLIHLFVNLITLATKVLNIFPGRSKLRILRDIEMVNDQGNRRRYLDKHSFFLLYCLD